MILGRSENGPEQVPVLKGFLILPQEIPEPLGKAGKKHRSAKRARSGSVVKPNSSASGAGRGKRAASEAEIPSGEYDGEGTWVEKTPPEDGMDDRTPEEVDCIDWKTDELVPRRAYFLCLLVFYIGTSISISEYALHPIIRGANFFQNPRHI